jgi:hypothetical protein
MTDEELAERLALERAQILDLVAQAFGRRFAEIKDECSTDFLNREVAALWRTIAQLQKSLAELHAERIRAISGNESVDAKKLN